MVIKPVDVLYQHFVVCIYRLITMGLGGEAYLNFIGFERGGLLWIFNFHPTQMS